MGKERFLDSGVKIKKKKKKKLPLSRLTGIGKEALTAGAPHQPWFLLYSQILG